MVVINPFTKYLPKVKKNPLTTAIQNSQSRNTYDPKTNTYTDQYGNKSSVAPNRVGNGGSPGRSSGRSSSGSNFSTEPTSDFVGPPTEQQVVNKKLVDIINQKLINPKSIIPSSKIGNTTIITTTGRSRSSSQIGNERTGYIDYSKENEINFNYDPAYRESRNVTIIRNKKVKYSSLSTTEQQSIRDDTLKNQTVTRINADGTRIYANQKGIDNYFNNDFDVTQTSANTYKPNTDFPFSYGVTTTEPIVTTSRTWVIDNNQVKDAPSLPPSNLPTAFKSEVNSQILEPYVVPIKSGFKQMFTGNFDTTNKNFKFALNDAFLGAKVIKNKAKNKFIGFENTLGSGYNTILTNPRQAGSDFITAERDIGTYIKGTTLYTGGVEVGGALVSRKKDKIAQQDLVAGLGIVRNKVKDPTFQAKALLIGIEVATPFAIEKSIGFAKGTSLRVVGDYVNPKELFSERALATEGKSVKGAGLTTGFTTKQNYKNFLSTKGKIKEYPELYSGIHTTNAPSEITKVNYTKPKAPLFESKLISKTIGNNRVGNLFTKPKLVEDPILYVASQGQGSTRFLRLSGEEGTGISLNPFSVNIPNPKMYNIGAKRVKMLPKRVLNKKGFEVVGEFQESNPQKSTFWITKRRTIGGTSEDEAGISNLTNFFRIKTKKPLYTVINGKAVEIKKVIALDDLPLSNKVLKSEIKSKRITLAEMNKGTQDYQILSSGGSRSPKAYFPIDRVFNSISKGTAKATSKLTPSYSKLFSSSYGFSKPTYSTSSSKSSSTSLISYGSSSFSSLDRYSSGRSYGESSGFSSSGSSSSSSRSSSSSYSSRSSRGSSSSRSSSGRSSGGSSGGSSGRSSGRDSIGAYYRGKSISSGIIENGSTYRVQIKSGSNWVNVKDKTRRNLGSALEFGSSIVDNYKERSFRLRKSSGKPTDIKPIPMLGKFYQPSKRKNPKLTNAWIEKTPYLIDRRNEVIGISYKGIQAKRNKRK